MSHVAGPIVASVSPEPVEIEHRRDHAFVKQSKRPCADCGRPKTHPVHLGGPQSLNVGGSGSNHFAYQTAKKQWQAVFTALLEATGLPTGLARIVVEGERGFPDRTRRDQGNFRFMIEKALGDALVTGGWLEDDDWQRYSFGDLAYRYKKGEAWTRLMLFPTAAQSPVAA